MSAHALRAAVAASLFSFASTAAAQEHFMILFASQRADNHPSFSHSFAVFMRVSKREDGEKKIETHALSWLPASGRVVLGRLLPERGRNFGLKETLHWAARSNARITAWGPFEIDKTLYGSALRQIRRLQSGAVAYKAVDVGVRPLLATNCIHALTDLDAASGFVVTGAAHGEAATLVIAHHLRPWIRRANGSHAWIAEELGLDRYGITYRTLSP